MGSTKPSLKNTNMTKGRYLKQDARRNSAYIRENKINENQKRTHMSYVKSQQIQQRQKHKQIQEPTKA